MSLLLALPGELRNRIYEVAVESCQDAPAHLRHISRGPFPANRPKDWCELSRAFLGLTQTCRQIRKEFLAIHQTRVKVCVDITGIERYCSDILSHHELGNVVIEHDGSWKGGVWTDEDVDINIRELILLTSRCKEMNIEWAKGIMPRDLYKVLVSPAGTYDKFLRYLAERADKAEFGAVRYCCGDDPDGRVHMIDALLVYPNEQYVEDWMRQACTLPLEEWYEAHPSNEYEPLNEETQKGCDWTDNVFDWHTQLGLPRWSSIVVLADDAS
ncbi:hypothetical protein E8E13_006251 [Curvularia kusanoi]|uniref:Uncharacterized protein n=1 Tax=Curvularia kusanoi TaxID=90978 RepID=A0A9P4TI40_CURKU|nr:hypothetical protein E8E13_006251 [Curvularia kusanoi]